MSWNPRTTEMDLTRLENEDFRRREARAERERHRDWSEARDRDNEADQCWPDVSYPLDETGDF